MGSTENYNRRNTGEDKQRDQQQIEENTGHKYTGSDEGVRNRMETQLD